MNRAPPSPGEGGSSRRSSPRGKRGWTKPAGVARLLAVAVTLSLPWEGLGAPVAEPDPDRPAAAMKARVFEIKHQDTGVIMSAIRPLGSGARGALISESDSLRTITVRDFPENLAAIEVALRRLDTPSAPRPDLELRLRILIAGPSGPGQFGADLDPLVKQLQSALTFKSYYEIAAVTHRVKAGSGAGGNGEAQLVPPVSDEPTTAEYGFSLDNMNVAPTSGGQAPQVHLRKFKFFLRNKALGDAQLNTALTVREGKPAVVGTGSLRNRAVIVVLSAKVLK
jgi:hypothetical protein